MPRLEKDKGEQFAKKWSWRELPHFAEESILIGSSGEIVTRWHVSVPRAKTKEKNKPSTRVEALIFYGTEYPHAWKLHNL